MAKQAQPKLNWFNIDVATLDPEMRALYDAYKASYAAMKAARLAFEGHMQRLAPEGKRLAFAYNFGKLSAAIADAEPEKAKAPSGAISLSALLKRV